MIALLLAIIHAGPQCGDLHSLPSCEAPTRALVRLARETSSGEVAWAAVSFLAGAPQCRTFLPISRNAKAPSPDETWLGLVDVEARMTELSSDLMKNDWQWAFAWADLTASECPDEPGLRHQCRAFAALRDSRWDTLLKLLQQEVVLGAHDDALLEMVARLGLGQREIAQALAERAEVVARVEEHPLPMALDTIALRLSRHQTWNQDIPELNALSAEHGLRRLTHSGAH